MIRGRPDPHVVERVVAAALEEDLDSTGDITTWAVVPEGTLGRGTVRARQDLVLAGILIAREVFRQVDPDLVFEASAADGERVTSGTPVATVTGPARGILVGERTALNFLMRLSGIATAASAAAAEVRGTGAVVLDTRKTAPGLRALDKYAVAVGGATNHRHGLHDAVLIKDTHLALVGSVSVAVQRALDAGHPRESVTVEVRSIEDLDEAIAAGAGRALLDNMELTALRACVERAAGRIVLEASGGLALGRLRDAARTGVHFLSVGSLTHSVAAADLALEMESI